MKKNYHLEIYNSQYNFLWELMVCYPETQRGTYRGVKQYGNFLLSEIDWYETVEKSGEVAIERRGLVSPKSLMKAWAFNILEECYVYRIIPPRELIHAIYCLMDCKHLDEDRYSRSKRWKYDTLREQEPNIGVREAARKLDVNPTTISRWNLELKVLIEPNHAKEYNKLTETINDRLKKYFPIR